MAILPLAGNISKETTTLLHDMDQVNHHTAHSTFAPDPTHQDTIPLPPLSSTHNPAPVSDDLPQCRICGESELDDDEDSDHFIANDEEAVIGIRVASTRWQDHQLLHLQQKPLIRRKNPLIRPCKCKGSMSYVHVKCLNRWRTMSPRKESFVACDLCGYHYNIYRPRYAAILSHPYFLNVTTLFFTLASVIAMAYLCKVIDVFALHHLPQPENEAWFKLHGPTMLWMDRIYLLSGVSATALLGVFYLVYVRVICESDPHTTHPLLCGSQDTCPWYSLYLADVTACSGDAAIGGLLAFLVVLILMIIVFGILGAMTGVYTLMEFSVERLAGKVKERILDVSS
ncbi:uncharacterized protein BYT42DRAFT_577543 [Radiomyces spectabilis]|uniref:uncharacterized protein n=1 Tax=Radiomyces spectabilis TaxID=64574 RepID=UPI00221F91AE|nr:uncharacterized protein BYT42DRAFT_577543 [Radiomyces spectabilis]KAI8374756.1 hypothetical protein BYT42DRAFT_577543 [Radiomyces spectabilis]